MHFALFFAVSPLNTNICLTGGEFLLISTSALLIGSPVSTPEPLGSIDNDTSIEARFVATADDDNIVDSFLFFAGVCAMELGIFGIANSCFIVGAGTSRGSDSLSC